MTGHAAYLNTDRFHRDSKIWAARGRARVDVVLIPAYDNGEAIGSVVREALKHADAVIVCDDGSGDDTAAQAEKAGAAVLRHTKNAGKGGALRTLLAEARRRGADRAVTIDGDGQFDASEIPKLLQTQRRSGADVVVGCRFGEAMPGYRKLGNKIFDKMTSMAADVGVRDTQSGFRVYSKKAVEQISFESDGFSADAEMLVDAARKGLSMAEEKIAVTYETGGRIHSQNPVSHGYGVFSALLEHVAVRHPLKLLGIPGLVLFALGIGYSVVVISIFNDIGYFSVPSTLVALGSLMCGLTLLLMSVVLYAVKMAGRP